MHWLGLFPGAYGDEGGIAQFNRHLLDALAADPRIDLTALGLAGNPAVLAPRSLRWRIPATGSAANFGLSAAAAALAHRPRVVISGHAHFGALAYPIATLARARLLTITHGVEVWQKTSFAAHTAIRRSTLVTTVSRYTRERLLSWCQVAPERVIVLANTIDLTRYQSGPRSPQLEARFGLAGKKVLLTVGRLSALERYKGHDRVLPLLPELARAVGPLHYLIAGAGDDRARLEAIAANAGASGLVTFVGFVPDDALADYYRLADAFVMPSTGEGFGIVYLEAMASGCPVIAGDRDGSRDALRDGALGRLVNPDDGRDLRDAIIATLQQGRSHEDRIAGVEHFDLPRFHADVRALVTRLE
ncbi:MAG: glycosyltransferase family 4 protein [Myxococcales bacterium]|nr:glycosyltransferase family 4 protein [Myxococcales bacterium]